MLRTLGDPPGIIPWWTFTTPGTGAPLTGPPMDALVYRNNNAQYNIINYILPVVFQIYTCFIVLRKVSSITLGVFIGQRSSSSISSSVASGKIPVHK